jgi:hypothetical protein
MCGVWPSASISCEAAVWPRWCSAETAASWRRAGLALRRTPGRYGLVYLDGHTDFRNPGNSDLCASLAGRISPPPWGRHWPAIADIDGLRAPGNW